MQWTIKKKLALGFGLAALLIVGCVTIARWAQIRAAHTEELVAHDQLLLRDMQYLSAYVNRASVLQRGFLISGDEEKLNKLATLRAEANPVVERIKTATSADPDEKQLMDSWFATMLERRAIVDKLNTARRTGGFEAAKAVFDTGEDNRLYQLLEEDSKALQKLIEAHLTESLAQEVNFQRDVAWAEYISGAIALALLAGILFLLTGSIDQNIAIAIRQIEAMADKDLSIADAEPATSDELATAIHAINHLKLAMNRALGEVARSSTQVAGAGAEIESTARQIAETTHHERQNVELFASALAQMNAAIRDVAQHAERASLSANDAVSTATDGRELVLNAQQAMDRIHKTVTTAAGDITRLGEESRAIGEVVRIIEEIAGQTNLLALNAAIEAARAGEHGKGFAVVAQEVRQLAERTGTFTKEIAGKIEAVQQGAERAVTSMQEGEAVVNDGVEQFNSVRTSLDAIMQGIESVQQGIAMIATASTEQSAAADGLTHNIHDISSEVGQQSQRADQTAAACAELAKLAAALEKVVDAFRLAA